ncbi:Protein COFACTOR ASSEMBLY OF COMPLEX C SUBUNIT B CCB4, chloroplastic [Linum perenne]
MEAGTLLHRATACSFSSRRHLHLPPREVRASSSNSQKIYKGLKPKRDFVPDLVSSNDDSVRRLPIYVGGGALASVLVNRAVSGIAPVADASSSQSRADLLTLGLAVTSILTGLVWLTIKPKSISVVRFSWILSVSASFLICG